MYSLIRRDLKKMRLFLMYSEITSKNQRPFFLRAMAMVSLGKKKPKKEA